MDIGYFKGRLNPGINPGIPGLTNLNPEIPGLESDSGIANPNQNICEVRAI